MEFPSKDRIQMDFVDKSDDYDDYDDDELDDERLLPVRFSRKRYGIYGLTSPLAQLSSTSLSSVTSLDSSSTESHRHHHQSHHRRLSPSSSRSGSPFSARRRPNTTGAGTGPPALSQPLLSRLRALPAAGNATIHNRSSSVASVVEGTSTPKAPCFLPSPLPSTNSNTKVDDDDDDVEDGYLFPLRVFCNPDERRKKMSRVQRTLGESVPPELVFRASITKRRSRSLSDIVPPSPGLSPIQFSYPRGPNSPSSRPLPTPPTPPRRRPLPPTPGQHRPTHALSLSLPIVIPSSQSTAATPQPPPRPSTIKKPPPQPLNPKLSSVSSSSHKRKRKPPPPVDAALAAAVGVVEISRNRLPSVEEIQSGTRRSTRSKWEDLPPPPLPPITTTTGRIFLDKSGLGEIGDDGGYHPPPPPLNGHDTRGEQGRRWTPPPFATAVVSPASKSPRTTTEKKSKGKSGRGGQSKYSSISLLASSPSFTPFLSTSTSTSTSTSPPALPLPRPLPRPADARAQAGPATITHEGEGEEPRPRPEPQSETQTPTWRRKEKEWSGEWNVPDMQEVVKVLRRLRAS